MKEQRQYQRIQYRARVYFGIERHEYLGFTEDISMGGLHIASTTPMPPGTKFQIGFGTDKNNPQI